MEKKIKKGKLRYKRKAIFEVLAIIFEASEYGYSKRTPRFYSQHGTLQPGSWNPHFVHHALIVNHKAVTAILSERTGRNLANS